MCSTRRGFDGVGVQPLRCTQDTAMGECRALPFAVCTGAPLLLDSYFFFCLFFFFLIHTSSFPLVLSCALSPWLHSRCMPAGAGQRPEAPVCAVLLWALVLEMASCGECSSLACGGQTARVCTRMQTFRPDSCALRLVSLWPASRRCCAGPLNRVRRAWLSWPDSQLPLWLVIYF